MPRMSDMSSLMKSGRISAMDHSRNSRSHVVHGHLVAFAPVMVEGAVEQGEILGGMAFGDLEHHVVGFQAEGFEQLECLSRVERRVHQGPGVDVQKECPPGCQLAEPLSAAARQARSRANTRSCSSAKPKSMSGFSKVLSAGPLARASQAKMSPPRRSHDGLVYRADRGVFRTDRNSLSKSAAAGSRLPRIILWASARAE